MATQIPGALGVASHREGKNTLALGDFSHAEGEGTQAQGKSAHAEGGVTAAIGIASHTEGAYTVATGQQAHAEGHGTIAKNFAQHTEGIYNKGDSNNTVHETGIGLADDDRKNGFEVYIDGAVKAPEQTFEMQKDSDGFNLATIDYLDKKNLSVQKTPNGLNEIILDFGQRETNFFVEFNNDIIFNRPLNMKRGQSGFIHFCNQTLDDKVINFDNYTFGVNNQETLNGDFNITKVSYTVIDDNNIELEIGQAVTPHLPIQIGSGNYLAINTNGDALLN